MTSTDYDNFLGLYLILIFLLCYSIYFVSGRYFCRLFTMEMPMLPTGRAREPIEGAQNPTVKTQQNTASQKSYKTVLSLPPPGISHRQKLLWLQKRRSPGLWVQCDDCDQWRYLPDVLDRNELPDKWYCCMNPDASQADCSVPESPIRLREEEDLIHSAYSAGSVVWARMSGWPWWPAMVADCPDCERFYWLDGFSDIPTHYNVVFFDSDEVTRAWISLDNLKPYNAMKSTFSLQIKAKIHDSRFKAAITQADDASNLSLEERLSKYSFVARYKGNIGTPKKVTKKELIRFQKKLEKSPIRQ